MPLKYHFLEYNAWSGQCNIPVVLTSYTDCLNKPFWPGQHTLHINPDFLDLVIKVNNGGRWVKSDLLSWKLRPFATKVETFNRIVLKLEFLWNKVLKKSAKTDRINAEPPYPLQMRILCPRLPKSLIAGISGHLYVYLACARSVCICLCNWLTFFAFLYNSKVYRKIIS